MKKRKILLLCLLLLFLLCPNKIALAETLDDISACENPEVLKVIYFGLLIIDIIKIIIPIGLIVMGIVDFSKSVATNDDSARKKNVQLFAKRLLYGALVFLVPWIIKVVIINLGDLTEDVNFSDCLKNANQEKIAELQPRYDKLVEEYEKEHQQKPKEHIEKDKEHYQVKDDESSTPTNPTEREEDDNINFDSSAKVKIKYSSEIVENLASFIGHEAGANPEGFEAQLMTGAVFMNNLYFSCGRSPFVTSPEQITTDKMCNLFSYQSLYSSDYCYNINGKFSSISGLTANQKNQLTIVAKILLSGMFTIPKDINGEGKLSNWGEAGAEWGSLATRNGCTIDKYREDGCSQVYGYSKYCVSGGLSNQDIYGNAVSTNFSDYKSISDSLYRKYITSAEPFAY